MLIGGINPPPILNGGNTRPPVISPIGNLRFKSEITSRPALLNGAGRLPNKPPKGPPAFISGDLKSESPICICPALSMK